MTSNENKYKNEIIEQKFSGNVLDSSGTLRCSNFRNKKETGRKLFLAEQLWNKILFRELLMWKLIRSKRRQSDGYTVTDTSVIYIFRSANWLKSAVSTTTSPDVFLEIWKETRHKFDYCTHHKYNIQNMSMKLIQQAKFQIFYLKLVVSTKRMQSTF